MIKEETVQSIHNTSGTVGISEENLKENLVLKSIVDRSANKPDVGTLIEGVVISVLKSSVFVDLPPFGTGIIYGREFINAKEIIKKSA